MEYKCSVCHSVKDEVTLPNGWKKAFYGYVCVNCRNGAPKNKTNSNWDFIRKGVQIMFNPNDEVKNKYTGEPAIVLHIDSDELMTVVFRTNRFSKGYLDGYGTQVLIKNFELR